MGSGEGSYIHLDLPFHTTVHLSLGILCGFEFFRSAALALSVVKLHFTRPRASHASVGKIGLASVLN
jgi:hypothetical protein